MADRVQSNTTQPLPNTPGWEPEAGPLEGLRSEEGPPGHYRLSQGVKLQGSRAGLRESSLSREDLAPEKPGERARVKLAPDKDTRPSAPEAVLGLEWGRQEVTQLHHIY